MDRIQQLKALTKDVYIKQKAKAKKKKKHGLKKTN
jgi:hypothetical protein